MNTVKDLKTQPPAEEGYSYFCIGDFCWGKGKTATEAFKNARHHGSSKGKYILHYVNSDAKVDGVDGSLHYRSTAPNVRLKILTIKVR